MPRSKRIPPAAAQRHCGFCQRPFTVDRKSAHYDNDGGAMVNLRCKRCRIQGVFYWNWKW